MEISKRHIAKSISWRLVGTVDTFLFAWFITEDLNDGIGLSAITTLTKTVWYYLHERFWFNSSVAESNRRHLMKTFSWRAIGTLDTLIFGWILTGDASVGVQIGLVETSSKLILYFIHEKFWYRSSFGLDAERSAKS